MKCLHQKLGAACLAAILFGGVGCQEPQKEQSNIRAIRDAKPTHLGTNEPKEISLPPQKEESNIVRVNKFFSSVPWLNFDSDGSGSIDGFKCTVYLEGPHSVKGVFGTGTIVVSMYRLDSDRSGREFATEVYSWTLPREEAFVYRAREATMFGWGYGLRLQWGKKVDVGGRKVAVLIKYIRDDGRVVSSTRQVLRVPLTGHDALAFSRGEAEQSKSVKPVLKPGPRQPGATRQPKSPN